MKYLLSNHSLIKLGVLCLLNAFCCPAQIHEAPPLKFEHYTSASGLAHGETQCMMKDSRGFLWIGSSDGLLCYDGYEVKIFRNDQPDHTTMSRGWPTAIAEDSKGIIWLYNTIPNGLNAYDPGSGKFKRYADDSSGNFLLPSSWVTNIFIDRKDQLWISTGEEGLFHFDPVTGKSIIYSHDSLNSESLANSSVINIFQQDENHLYVGLVNGFDILDMNSGKCRHFKIEGNFWNRIFKDSKNNLWACTLSGLVMFDPQTERFKAYRHVAGDPYSISSDSLLDMCESPDGRLWITTARGQLNVFDINAGKFFHYQPDNEQPPLSDGTYPHYILYDVSGKIWMQGNYSIDAVNLQPEKFELFQHDEKNKNSLCWNTIQYIYQDRHEKVFVATMHGVSVFDPATKTFHLFQPDPAINYLLDDNRVDIIFQDKDDTYWMEIDQQKLVSWNPHSRQSKIYDYHPDHHPDSLGIHTIYCIYQDAGNTIWFGGEFCLCSFNPQTKKFKTYPIDDHILNPVDNSIVRIIDVNDGKLWLAANGLHYYDYQSNVIHKSSFNVRDKNSWVWNSGDFITSYVADGKQVWMGSAHGLFLLDINTGQSRNYTVKDGLPNNTIWGILKDHHSNLWLTTNNGLCRFTPPESAFDETQKGTYRIYNTSDGIPANEFAWNNYCQLNDGTILCGTISNGGLISFHPDSLKDNPFIPPVYITKFSLFNEEVIPSDSGKFLRSTIETTKEIKLSYRENVISFAFAALNFVHPENNHYAYKLEGFDKDWIYTDASKRFAEYTNLDPGNYTFMVKGSNNDRVWNEVPATIYLIITPPFWKTWWFSGLMIMAGGLLIFGMFRYRLREVIHLQNIRNKIAGDLHDEIGSTLNSISIYSEVVKNKSKEDLPELKLMGEASRRVIDAMSDIVWTINPENDSFEKIIFRMRSLTHSLMKAKKIEYSFRADESLNDLKLAMIMRKNFYLIFKEALNNLVKYSNATRASVSLVQTGSQIELLVRDNGIGFDSKSVARGNGISNMNRRAQEIKAKFAIESSTSSGTNVQLLLNKKSKK